MSNSFAPHTTLKPPHFIYRIPIVGYVLRTWLLLAFTIGFNCIPLWNHAFFWLESGKDEWGNAVYRGVTAFEIIGAPIYIPGIVLLVYWMIGLCIHLYFRNTVDADVGTGRYQSDWDHLSATNRCYISAAYRIAGGLIGAIVAHGVCK